MWSESRQIEKYLGTKACQIGEWVCPAGRIFTKKWKFQLLGAAYPPPCTDWGDILHVLADMPLGVPNFTWIDATSRASVARTLNFGLWANEIPAVAASRRPAGNNNCTDQCSVIGTRQNSERGRSAGRHAIGHFQSRDWSAFCHFLQQFVYNNPQP